ncbi:uncharacterized protein MELLADRAFT_94423 [Melampsora larici-populina 98AG31]|uniref:Uncharacterized protein n=1 Tax=Melampsora larici-populina (strain 98AG31 / pathotype 3-4-7) TaxID=747676 RepID=F4RBG5_MELLP|nr:uncharacterized protein MELLADRAFT_94423 [Melampsora larici-populina 98AG31]EGG10365.1 hypothetical protein MELLADRAFT_94423 [Melampsora larici-populina 98AG31]
MSSIIHRTQPKPQLYARYLDTVRSAALWDHKAPITIKGQLITASSDSQESSGALLWSELIRKFLKHNPERPLTAESATIDQALRAKLTASSQKIDYDHDRYHLVDQPEVHFFDIFFWLSDLILTCVSWQIGRVALAPLILDQDKDKILEMVNKLKTSIESHTSNSTQAPSRTLSDINSAKIIVGFSQYTIGDFTQSITILEECNYDLPKPDLTIHTEKYDIVLQVLAHTVLALSYESSEAAFATTLDSYKKAASTYGRCLSHLAITAGNEGNEEMHSWAEVGLYRYALISRKASDDQITLEAHRLYHSYSRYWPNSFRYGKRCVFYKSYLRILIDSRKSGKWTPAIMASVSNFASSNMTLSSEIGSIQNKTYWQAWRTEVFGVQRAYEHVLKLSGSFPKSGAINQPVLEFCDLLFEAWRVDGCESEEAKHIIEMLYRATRQTFHSHKILRYLVRLLSAQHAFEEASQALDLYVQLFTKAKEIESPKGSPDPTHLDPGVGSPTDAIEPNDQNGNSMEASDHDSDEDFIETLVFGCRLWIKFLSDPEKAFKLITRASELIEANKAKSRAIDVSLEAQVERFLGLAAGAQAQIADSETRPELHATYLKHLIRAAELDPNSYENLYHLAFAQAELRDIESALVSARKAVDINSNKKIGWHLLGLLTSASKEPRLALDIIDIGLNDEGDDGSENGSGTRTPKRSDVSGTPILGTLTPPINTESPSDIGGTSNGIPSPEGNAYSSTNGSPAHGVSESNSDALSTPRRDTFLNVPSHTKSSSRTSPISTGSPALEQHPNALNDDRLEELEAMMQLRITKNVILESMDGPEVALTDQQALFSYFAQIAPQLRRGSSQQMSPYGIASKSGMASNASVITAADRSEAANVGDHLGSRSRSTIIRRKLIGKKGSTDTSTTPAGSPNKPVSRAISLSLRHPRHGSNSVSEKRSVMASKTSLLKSESGNVALNENQDQSGNELIEGKVSKADKLLQSLWLMSAATFRRWGKMDECLGAIQEAESLDSDEADVWVQYALYKLSISDLNSAIESLSKALSFTDDHISAIVHISRILKEEGSLEVSEGLLETLTISNGWDVPEAWFLLSEIYSLTDRKKRSRDSLIYALNLEQTKPIRPLRFALPRCL